MKVLSVLPLRWFGMGSHVAVLDAGITGNRPDLLDSAVWEE